MNKKNAKIRKRAHSFKGCASSYNNEILNFFNRGIQLKDTESKIKNKLIKILTELRGFKFVTTLALRLKKRESDDKTKHDIFYSHLKRETIINESNIDDVFESTYITAISNIQKFLGKGSDWYIDSATDHNINILKIQSLS